MPYLYLLVAVLGAALIWTWKQPGERLAKVSDRLNALDANRPVSLPLDPPRVAEVQRRRRRRTRRRQWGEWAARVGPGAGVALAALCLLARAWQTWGLGRTGLTLALVAVGAWLVGWCWERWRCSQVRRQFLPALQLFAQQLSATNSDFTALEAVVSLAPFPIAEEFRRVRAALLAGATDEQAWAGFARRTPSAEIRLVSEVLRRVEGRGARLAGLLFTVHGWLVERARLRRRRDRRADRQRGLAWGLVTSASLLAALRLGQGGGLPLAAEAGLLGCALAVGVLDGLASELRDGA